MEEQDHNRYSYEQTFNKITILLQTEQVNLTEEEKATLQQILDESFNIAYSDFDIQKAVKNLRKNFERKVALCHECLFAKQCAKLEEHQGYCNDVTKS